MLPCCHYLSSSGRSPEKSPFPWKHPDRMPPLRDDDAPEHLPLLQKYGLPFIIDVHTHFFPEYVMKRIWKWFDGVHWEIAYRENETARLESLRKNGIRHFTTLNYAHKEKMAEGLNRWTFETHANTKNAILFGTFFPEEGCLEYVRRAVEDYGFRGFKLHCEVGRLDLTRKELSSTFSYLEKKSIPLVIHSGDAPLPGPYTNIRYFRTFIERYPTLKVIVAHMGTSEVWEYAELLSIFPELRLDTTMVFVDFLATGTDTDPYLEVIERFPDRVHFGSDFPSIPYALSHPICNLLNSALSDEIKRKVFLENSARLFSIDPNS
ncbi:amidohydrolase [Leptospira gomenensis]|uniref:Amidohydrolase n=1 Tax=Leptospira gomenensis TaxID=2484974 RepID=A0A5F1Y821_9LEPT|nr:amidohydrolase family protein [Leptospira gomenensis]TGK31022.1 amidohydrolase [Leptospira gomenensis]TGK43389.1 amidohydrolase [Leptospira gomenensis]TGK45258.1 amidohydrolase [Leptospira gomenensis]TGK66284.1 amidohydrolase [Leptospira gomenensis]